MVTVQGPGDTERGKADMVTALMSLQFCSVQETGGDLHEDGDKGGNKLGLEV